MKKVFFVFVASAILAVGCAKVQEPDVPDQPVVEGVEFSLNVAPTKTVADGFATKWVAGDEINVFNAPAAGAFAPQGAFAIDEAGLEAGTFTGTIEPLEADTYSWVAVYPYDEANESLAALSLTIGSAETALATSPALAGGNVPLLGSVADVAKDDAVSIVMHQLASAIALTVKNPNDEAYALSEIALTFPVAVAGDFTVNASDLAAISYAAAESASKTLTFKASEPVSIAAGKSVTFYAPVAPVAVAKDSEISYTIDGKDGEITVAANMNFKAGVVKRVSVNIPETNPATDSPVLLNPGPAVTHNEVDLFPALGGRFYQLADWTHNNTVYPTVDSGQIAVFAAHAWGCGDAKNAKFYQTFKLLPGTYKFVTNTRHSTQDSWVLGAPDGRPRNFVNAWAVACVGNEINSLTDAEDWQAGPAAEGLLGSVDLANNTGKGDVPKANAVKFTLAETTVVSVGVVYSLYSWDSYQWLYGWVPEPKDNNALPWMDLYISNFEFTNISGQAPDPNGQIPELVWDDTDGDAF